MPKFSASMTCAKGSSTPRQINVEAKDIRQAFKTVYDNHAQPGDNISVASEDHLETMAGFRRQD